MFLKWILKNNIIFYFFLSNFFFFFFIFLFVLHLLPIPLTHPACCQVSIWHGDASRGSTIPWLAFYKIDRSLINDYWGWWKKRLDEVRGWWEGRRKKGRERREKIKNLMWKFFCREWFFILIFSQKICDLYFWRYVILIFQLILCYQI